MMSRKHLLRRIQNRREIPINWIITSIDCSLYVLLFKMKSCTSNILVTKVKKKNHQISQESWTHEHTEAIFN
jgi:hypothetical protein